MQVEIFTAKDQPACNFVVDPGEGYRKFRVRYKKRHLLLARCCWQPRIAANCVFQDHYDEPRFFCRAGKGCKRNQPPTGPARSRG